MVIWVNTHCARGVQPVYYLGSGSSLESGFKKKKKLYSEVLWQLKSNAMQFS